MVTLNAAQGDLGSFCSARSKDERSSALGAGVGVEEETSLGRWLWEVEQ